MAESSERTNEPPPPFALASTRVVRVDGAKLVYLEVGAGDGPPLVGLIRLGANLDGWGPEPVDPLATERRVILIGYRGVGASTGSVQDSFEDMAADVIAAIRGLGLARVDLFGLSMGGMVAQAVVAQAPELVNRLILAGTGPQGGPGLTRMTGITIRTVLKSFVTATPATSLLFFTRTATGKRAAKTYDAGLKRRRTGEDRPVTPSVFRAQLRAVNRWGHQQSVTPGRFAGPVIIFHGDRDRMVPPGTADALRDVFPQAEVTVFPDSGHAVVSQNQAAITERLRTFLNH